MDLIVSLGCYDRRVCAYIAAAVLISLRSKLMDREVMSQDWQALQFFSRLNGGAVQVDMNQVSAVLVLPIRASRNEKLVIQLHALLV